LIIVAIDQVKFLLLFT